MSCPSLALADDALDVVECAARVAGGLRLGGLPDEALPLLREGDVRRRGALPDRVGQHLDPPVPPHWGQVCQLGRWGGGAFGEWEGCPVCL